MKLLPGYQKPGTILELSKALYSLRRSPLLWQKELDSALQAICLCLSLMNTVAYLTRDDVPLFFYFDDIVDTNKENHETIAIWLGQSTTVASRD